MPGDILALVGVVLTSFGFTYYKLGKLSSKADNQSKAIERLERIVINGNSKNKRGRSKSCQD